MDPRTFADGVLGEHDSVKGFRLIASDGNAGHVSWASYAPGESYLVVTLGRFGRKHHVVPAGAVTRVSPGEVRVGLAREDIKRLPDLPHPDAPLDGQTWEQTMAAFDRAYAHSYRT
jgi:hypothetical protein